MLTIMKSDIFLYFFLSALSYLFISVHGRQNVAIIGAGIGGTSCAIFLNELFSGDINIDIYEKEKIGGRLKWIQYEDYDIETGGSMIHEQNYYMSQFVQTFNLKKNLHGGSSLVIYNEYAKSLRPYSELKQRFEPSITNLSKYVNETLEIFSKIYSLQSQNQSFKTVKEFLAAIDTKLQFSTNKSIYSWLKNFPDIKRLVVTEFAQSLMRANYGQSVKRMPGFVGFVSLVGLLGGMWSVDGGNKKIAEQCLKNSKATLYNNTVIELMRIGKYKCAVMSIGKDDSMLMKTYNFVVIATPLYKNMKNIKFAGFKNLKNFTGRFHNTVTTILEGELRPEYFGPNGEYYLKNVSDILNSHGGSFYSISKVKPSKISTTSSVGNNIWKVFSNNILSDTKIRQVFKNAKIIDVSNWLAYPEYKHFEDIANHRFVLDNNLFYINAIEWAASSMEMSVIGAKNVALLVYKASSIRRRKK